MVSNIIYTHSLKSQAGKNVSRTEKSEHIYVQIDDFCETDLCYEWFHLEPCWSQVTSKMKI